MKFFTLNLLLAATVVAQECTYQLVTGMNYDMLMSDSNFTPESERCELWRHETLASAEEQCNTEEDCVGVTYDNGYTCENDLGQQVLMRYEIRKGQLSPRADFNSWTKSCTSATTMIETTATVDSTTYEQVASSSCISLYVTQGAFTYQQCADRCTDIGCKYFSRPIVAGPNDLALCWTTQAGAIEGFCNENVYGPVTTTSIPSLIPTTSSPTFMPSANPATSLPTSTPRTSAPSSTPTITNEPLTLCENKDNSDNITDTFDEVVCLCEEYESEGWTWGRNVLTDDLERKVRKLEQAGGEVTDTSPAFLKKWKKRMRFHVYLHESTDDNTVNSAFYHRRVWRRICLSTKRRREMMRTFALKIDSLNM